MSEWCGRVKQTSHRFDELSNKTIGAAIQVHRELGPGFLESIYEQALRLELVENGIHFDPQKEVKIKYLGVEVGLHRLDLVIEDKIIVELKAVKALNDIHIAQVCRIFVLLISGWVYC